MSHPMSDEEAADIYNDVVAKHGGDHLKAQQAIAELGLPLPRWAPRLTAQSSRMCEQIQVDNGHGMCGHQDAAPQRVPTNPGFLCPLTGIVMRDPVILEATLISFERIAIMWWLSVNPDTCPVTGRPVPQCTLRTDDELRESIQEWAKRCAPQLLDSCGRLMPVTFPEGIQTAVKEHRAVSMALPATRSDAPNATTSHTTADPIPSAPPLPYPQQPLSSYPHSDARTAGGHHTQPPPHYPPPQASAAAGASHPHSHIVSSLYGYEPMHACQDQIQKDRAYAMALTQAATSTELPVATGPMPHNVVLSCTLATARSGLRVYTLLSPVINVVLVGGFLFSLYKNSWQMAPINQNPWLGPTADALRQSGGACTACIKRGQWWRLFTAAIVPAGLAHLMATMALVSISSTLAARTGLRPHAFCACIIVGAVAGSATAALTAPTTINSAASSLAAAAVAACGAAVLAVRRLVRVWRPPVLLLAAMLALSLVTGLAPLVDAWSTVAGAAAAGLCAAAFMAPYAAKEATKQAERRVVMWQVLIALVVVVGGAVVTGSLMVMPRTGYSCKLCRTLSCQNFLGWQCRAAINREGFCELAVYVDSRAVLMCPDGSEQALVPSRDTLSEQEVDQQCAERC